MRKINEITQYLTVILSIIIFKDITNKKALHSSDACFNITEVYLNQGLAITKMDLGGKARQPKGKLCTDSLPLIYYQPKCSAGFSSLRVFP